MKKIILVGTGAVGMSFIYSAINQGIQAKYIIIDTFTDIAEGHARDITDAIAALAQNGSTIQTGTYEECRDADVIVITAGRPQKSATETRLEMVADNAKIIAQISNSIKSSGFNGVTIIASNPCDVLTTVYQQITNFNEHKVISSGTMLDTVRMKRFLAKKLAVNTDAIDGFVLGEHGDKSVPAFSLVRVAGLSLDELIASKKITINDLKKIQQEIINEAYEIIRLKKATYYGIGTCLAQITAAIVNNVGCIMPVGIKLDKTFSTSDIYFGYPAKISEYGWEKLENLKLSTNEKNLFDESAKNLAEFCHQAFKASKIQ